MLLLLGFDANLGVELVWNMSVFIDHKSLGGKAEQIARSRVPPQICWMIESKQCENELDVIISFD